MQPDAIGVFLNCLLRAEEHGLAYEFVMSFFQDLNVSDEKIIEAANYGLMEWDM